MSSLILLLAACEREPSGSLPPAEATPHRQPMDPVALARRLSLDVRGRQPDLDEYQRVMDDASQIDALLEEWLHDPAFVDRIVSLYGEVFLTRTEDFPFNAYDLHVDDEAAFDRSLGEEPLRLVAQVAAEDLPYTDIVTADWTMADEVLAAAFPIDRPAGTGWLPSRYTDGRPAAGVLSTNGLMWRYPSSSSNLNRKRANQTSRILLCSDYLTRPIDFDRNVNLLEEGAVEEALTTNPACVNCHVSLDPLASYFYGYWWYAEDSAIEAAVYHPDRELLWTTATGVAPAYYGQPGRSLADLGRQIASDPRFIECAVETVFEALLRREVTLQDHDRLTVHRQRFLEEGLTVRALFRSVLSDPDYRSGNSLVEGTVPAKLATPDLLASSVEALTGFRWSYFGRDMLGTDSVGLRTLAGGADGTAVTRSARLPNATLVVVQQRLAELASMALLQDASRREALFTRLDPTASAQRPAMQQQLADLHLVLLGHVVSPAGEEVAQGLALWDELYAVNQDETEAWAGLVYALMRDPSFVIY